MLSLDTLKFVAEPVSKWRRAAQWMSGAAAIRFLCYHSVCDASAGGPQQDFALTTGEFRNQLQLIRRQQWTAISMQQALDLMSGRAAVEGRHVCLTFDDGRMDNWSTAWPILREFDYPAHFFVCPGLAIGAAAKNSGHMTRQILWELQSQGASIGSHSLSHTDLTQASDDELFDEVFRSKALLEDWLGCAIDTFAYPYGSYDERVAGSVCDAGYQAAFGVRLGTLTAKSMKRGAHRIPRTIVDHHEADQLFRLKLEGGYDWTAGYSVLKHYIRTALAPDRRTA